MSSWSVELLEFSIRYEPKGTIKAQYLEDFSSDLQSDKHLKDEWWTLYVYDSSNSKGVEVGIVP